MNNQDAILRAIASGCHRTREIAERTGIPRTVVQVRVADLRREGLVSSFRTLCGYRHGNEKFYRIREQA